MYHFSMHDSQFQGILDEQYENLILPETISYEESKENIENVLKDLGWNYESGMKGFVDGFRVCSDEWHQTGPIEIYPHRDRRITDGKMMISVFPKEATDPRVKKFLEKCRKKYNLDEPRSDKTR
jgi:hypothetical protein